MLLPAERADTFAQTTPTSPTSSAARREGFLHDFERRPSSATTKRAVVLTLHAAGEQTIAELAQLFSVSRATIYRELARSKDEPRPKCSGDAPVR